MTSHLFPCRFSRHARGVHPTDRLVQGSPSQAPRRRQSSARLAARATLAVLASLALQAHANAPATDLASLERQIAEAISFARQHPQVMAQELEAMLARPDGPYKHLLPDGAPVWSQPAWLKASVDEARAQPVLNALAWSDALAKVSKAWAPAYAKNNSVAHGRYAERLKGLNAMSIEAIGGSDPIAKTNEFNPKAFVYMFFVSAAEWTVGSPYDPRADKGQRGHRGIVNDTRMTAVGVGCAQEPGKPSVACVINLGKDLPDQGPLLVAGGSAPSPAPAPAPSTTAAPAPATTPSAGDRSAAAATAFPLRPGTAIVQNRRYDSESGRHYLMFQSDGNVVVKDAAGQYIWGLQSVVPNFGQTKIVEVQPDGNFAVYGANRVYIWSALHRNPDPSAFLTLTPEGVLRLVSGRTGATLWASDR